MEIWDIYDQYKHRTKKTHIRGVPLDGENYHLVVHVWIMNDKNEFLIQKRQPWKKISPGMWECSASGAALSGDNSFQAMIRETKEEIGVDIDQEKAEHLFTIMKKNYFGDLWLVRQNIKIESLILQPEEVSAAKWASVNEIKNMIKKKEFINFPFLDLIFEFAQSKIALIKVKENEILTLQTLYEDMILPLEILNNIADCYKIEYDNKLIGCVFLNEFDKGEYSILEIYLDEEFKMQNYEEIVLKRLELMYPQAKFWLTDYINDENLCSLFVKLGYVLHQEEQLNNVKYFSFCKKDNLLRIKTD